VEVGGGEERGGWVKVVGFEAGGGEWYDGAVDWGCVGGGDGVEVEGLPSDGEDVGVAEREEWWGGVGCVDGLREAPWVDRGVWGGAVGVGFVAVALRFGLVG